MSPAVGLGVVIAVTLLALALQLLSRQLRDLPLDQRRADPLIDVSSRATGSMRPAELHQLTTIVANATLSDASYRNELRPILDQLASGTTGTGSRSEATRRRPGGRTRRSDRIEHEIAQLEADGP